MAVTNFIEHESGRDSYTISELTQAENLNQFNYNNRLNVTLAASSKQEHIDNGLKADKYGMDDKDGSSRVVYGGQDVAGAKLYMNGYILGVAAVADGISTGSDGRPSGIGARISANIAVNTGLNVGDEIAKSATSPETQNGNYIANRLADAIWNGANKINRQNPGDGDCTATYAVVAVDRNGYKVHMASTGDSQVLISYFDPSQQRVVVEKCLTPTVKKVMRGGKSYELLDSSARRTEKVQTSIVDLQRYIDSGMKDLKVVVCSDYLGEKVRDSEELKDMIQPQHKSVKALKIEGKRPGLHNWASRQVAKLLTGLSRRDSDTATRTGAGKLISNLFAKNKDDGSFVIISVPDKQV